MTGPYRDPRLLRIALQELTHQELLLYALGSSMVASVLMDSINAQAVAIDLRMPRGCSEVSHKVRERMQELMDQQAEAN